MRHAGWVTLVVEDGGTGVADPSSALHRGISGGGSTGLGLDIARAAAVATGAATCLGAGLHAAAHALPVAAARAFVASAGR